MNFRRKILLGVAGFAVIAGPVAIGISNAPRGLAQSKAGAQTAKPSLSFEAASVRPAAPRTVAAMSLKAQSQPKAEKEVSFEAASIKLDPPDRRFVTGWEFRKNGLDGISMTIKSYIQVAYDITAWDWIIGPVWLNDNSPTYSIVANASGSVPEGTIRSMLQQLLKERFDLRTHTERRELPVYALVTGKSGFKLRPVQYDGPDADLCARPLLTGVEAKHCSMAVFARFLTSFTNFGRPVIDMTGVGGRYDFALTYKTRNLRLSVDPSTDTPEPSIFDAVKTIGLELEPRKAPVEVLVVDYVNKTPTEN